MVTSVLVYDATHTSIGQLPKGVQIAGYTTGTAGIRDRRAMTKTDHGR